MTTRIGGLATTIVFVFTIGPVHPQVLPTAVDTSLARAVLAAASPSSCAAGSSVVRVCNESTTGNTSVGSSPGSFGRGGDVPANAATADGRVPQRLDAVTVTGRSVPRRRSIETILQDALAPSTAMHKGPLEAHASSAGTRYECYSECTGTDCCIEVRTTPSPARDSNLIGR